MSSARLAGEVVKQGQDLTGWECRLNAGTLVDSNATRGRPSLFIAWEPWLLAHATDPIEGSANDYERSISDRLITVGDTLKILQSKMSRMRGSDLCVGQHYSIGACV